MSCPFCSIDESRVAFSNDLLVAIWGDPPVGARHILIIPKRHAALWKELSPHERTAVWSAIDQGQAAIAKRFDADSFSIGFNEGSAAGQTAPHFHMHITPRHSGKLDARKRLVTGGDDPLLPHLLLHLDESTD